MSTWFGIGSPEILCTLQKVEEQKKSVPVDILKFHGIGHGGD